MISLPPPSDGQAPESEKGVVLVRPTPLLKGKVVTKELAVSQILEGEYLEAEEDPEVAKERQTEQARAAEKVLNDRKAKLLEKRKQQELARQQARELAATQAAVPAQPQAEPVAQAPVPAPEVQSAPKPAPVTALARVVQAAKTAASDERVQEAVADAAAGAAVIGATSLAKQPVTGRWKADNSRTYNQNANRYQAGGNMHVGDVNNHYYASPEQAGQGGVGDGGNGGKGGDGQDGGKPQAKPEEPTLREPHLNKRPMPGAFEPKYSAFNTPNFCSHESEKLAEEILSQSNQLRGSVKEKIFNDLQAIVQGVKNLNERRHVRYQNEQSHFDFLQQGTIYIPKKLKQIEALEKEVYAKGVPADDKVLKILKARVQQEEKEMKKAGRKFEHLMFDGVRARKRSNLRSDWADAQKQYFETINAYEATLKQAR
ncbi:MAG: hypothetical protein PW734_11360 [Verrucomicrobium sp.]|nr:hypothetical protein [Verrucomicrobium sp.]